MGNREALEQAIGRGIHIVVASGRSFYTLPEEIRRFPGIEYAVTGNGAAMYHIPSESCLHRHLLAEEDVLTIMEVTEKDSVTYEAFIDGTAYAGKEYIENPQVFGASSQIAEYVRMTRRPEKDINSFIMENRAKLESIDIIVNDENKKKDIWERVKKRTNNVYITSSTPHLIEISHKNAGKHSGIAYFIDLLGLKKEEVAAFGDADNDVDMLLNAGYGVAMENASKDCKAAADYVTKNHNEDGVAYGLREILQVID